MAKYSFEFKMQVVNDYLNGNGGYRYLSQKYGIPQDSIIRKWVNAYNTLGAEGLKRSRQKKVYSFEFKLHAVELYLSSEVSYQELANTLQLNNHSLLVRWVNDFRAVGPDALRPHKKGRRSTVKNDKKKKVVKSEKLDTETAAYIKELEDELLKARIENAYKGYESLKEAIEAYIDYYDNERIKSKLNWKSPVQYRLENTA